MFGMFDTMHTSRKVWKVNLKTIVFNILDKRKYEIFSFVRFSTCWAHKLWILSPTMFVGPAVALQTLDPLFPMPILGVRTSAELTLSIFIINAVIGTLRMH
jgi:hypothetical protein